MDIEKPNASESMEDIFSKWLVEFQGRYWCDPEAMPPGAHDAYQMYIHYLSHGKIKDDSQVIEHAKKFKQTTGYEVADFKKYKDSLENKEK